MTIISALDNTLIDNNGKSWLDLQSGILNTPFGHSSDIVNIALHKILDTGLINTYDRVSVAQEELLRLMDVYQPGYTWKPFNTGAEAIEKAIQVAATHFDLLPRIAVLPNSFHGKMLSMAYANYGDKLPWGNPLDIIVIDPDDPGIPDFDVLIYEPIQGWDGSVNHEGILRELCDDNGALLIADEMITGFMRCGTRFVSQTADMIICGKGISAGVPLSLLGFRPELLEQQNGMIPVGWRTTGAGNNLSMTVGYTSLSAMMVNEQSIQIAVRSIQERLSSLGFSATGALGFKSLRNPARAKAYFEDAGIIASWHCMPQVRVGPSFITNGEELDRLEDALNEVDELCQ